MDSFRFDKKHLSELPSLQVRINLGYQYLTSAKALAGQWWLLEHEETGA